MNKAISNGNRQSETRNAGALPYVYSPTGSNRLFQTAAETTTYTYNALGERIKKRNQNGLQTVFHYGTNGELLYERDQAGNTKEYVWLDGRPIARIDNQTSIYYYHVDHLGTPQAMTDATGATVWKADYEPFGKANVRATSTVENNLRFPGQYFDRETGMHYNYFRDYDPSTGRYIEADPIGLEGGTNPYLYAEANPLMYTDPLGLWAWGDPLPQGVVDFSAGFGDTLSFGATDWLRDRMGTNGAVDKCSGAYSAGELAGVGYDIAQGGAIGWQVAGAKGVGKEFSHWIPNRMGGPRSKWNGNFVPTATHALSDPYRYRFMPRAWKAENPMPNPAMQQWVRIPDVYKGAVASGVAGATGASQSGCTCR